MTNPETKARVDRLAPLFAIYGGFMSLASASRLFKMGGELVFGVEARHWGFAVLALGIISFGLGFGALLQKYGKKKP